MPSSSVSKAWVYKQVQEFDRFEKIKENYTHIAPDSPFLPHSWPEYITHTLKSKEAKHSESIRRLAAKGLNEIRENREELNPTFDGKEFQDHKSSVLAKESIWLPNSDPIPGHGQAPWPTSEELEQEGIQRFKSGFIRFPPRPRAPGDENMSWRQRAIITLSDLDKVKDVSKLGEVKDPHDKREDPDCEIDDEMLHFVGDMLLKELDA